MADQVNSYDHKGIESKWQKKWSDADVYKTSDNQNRMENEFILVEFPYPSGNLHVGHWYAFAVTDIYAKYRRMLGKNVLFPVGFDAFGLPAENAAIKRNLNPKNWTLDNISYMTKQLQSMGASFDWSRKVVTCEPEYYKWTQWIFTKLFENGLAYQSETNVNWCPSCKTVLANEQVVSGKCERCSSEVVQKKMNQWQLRITKYADRLLDDLDKLDWPNPIKESQRNWIGRSHGSLIKFDIFEQDLSFKVFTTRADTLFGVTYVVLAPEHSLVEKILDKVSNRSEVENYIELSSKKTEMDRIADSKDKSGVKLENIFAINPANNQKIPVYISDYVLASYGTGAVMAVPAHDKRDFLFAKKFDLEIRPVIKANNDSENAQEDLPFEENGILINSEQFDGQSSEMAREAITKFVSGEITKNYRLRDWVISRQRYWGCPIPITHCQNCGNVAVPDSDLPVILPEISDYLPGEDGKSPLAKAKEWLKVSCPKCNSDAERETDTLDTFIDSSWYYLRYLDSNNQQNFSDLDKQKLWLPVDFYSGGSEHTTMHLLFARFFHKVLFDLGLVVGDEPFSKRLNRGLILGPDGNKMSKSKGNVIDPDEIVERLGADTVRGYLAFIGPYNEPGNYPWDPSGVVGIRRFIERVYRFKTSEQTSNRAKEELHKTIKKIGDDYAKLKFNTALAQAMTFINVAEKENLASSDFMIFIKLIFPIFPHLAEEIWQRDGGEGFVCQSNWPKYDESELAVSDNQIAVHINGKVRGRIDASPDEIEDELLNKAKNDPNISKWLDGQTVEKVIYIKGKLLSIVTNKLN